MKKLITLILILLSIEGFSQPNYFYWAHSAGKKPTVTTDAITAICDVSATGGGNVTDDGGLTVTGRGVCWNTSGTPTIADSKTTNGSGTGTFVSTLSSLVMDTYYYVRAWATNAVGTSYGGEVTFTTAHTYQSEAIYSYYESQVCNFAEGETAEPYLIDYAQGHSTSCISQELADQSARTDAQAEADAYGTCNPCVRPSGLTTYEYVWDADPSWHPEGESFGGDGDIVYSGGGTECDILPDGDYHRDGTLAGYISGSRWYTYSTPSINVTITDTKDCVTNVTFTCDIDGNMYCSYQTTADCSENYEIRIYNASNTLIATEYPFNRNFDINMFMTNTWTLSTTLYDGYTVDAHIY